MPQPTKAPSARERKRREKQSFDTAERNKERQKKTLTVGDKTFRRRLKNRRLMREASVIAEDQTDLLEDTVALERELREAEVGERGELRKQIRDISDQVLDKTYELACLLLEDDEGNSPLQELLEEKVDIEDINEFAKLGGSEPAEGPTRTPSSSS